MAGSGPAPPVAVGVEATSRRAFAFALQWPGWCRSGRDEAAALEALAGARGRYAEVAARAGLAFTAAEPRFEVVERLSGSATTDFGAPGAIASADAEPIGGEERGRLAAIVEAAWAVFDGTAAAAPAELRKGPRGGGRDRDAIVAHVAGADGAYARKLGRRPPPPAPGDTAAVAAVRAAILDALRAGGEGVEGTWPPRYAARRVAWHALDHAWEIDDRSGPGV